MRPSRILALLDREFLAGREGVHTPVMLLGPQGAGKSQRVGRGRHALHYFTDAEGGFPERAPDYPVTWLVTGNAPVLFGERVQLN